MVDALQIILATLVALIMLGLGATLTLVDFRRVVKHWKAPLVGFLSQFGVMPLLAFALASILGVSDIEAISFIVVGCTPGGSTSNLFTYLSKGDLPLSISMTALSTSCGLFMMPLLLLLYTPAFTSETVKVDYVSVVASLALVLVPVSIGVVTRHRSARVARILERVGSGGGVIFIGVAIVVGLVGDAWVLESGWKVWFASVTFLLFGAGCGFGLAWLAGLPTRQCRTVALECGIQNSTLSLTILAFTFPEKTDQKQFRDVARFPLLYSLFLIIDACLLTLLFRHLAKGESEQEGAEVQPKGAAEDNEGGTGGARAPTDTATPASAHEAGSTVQSDVKDDAGEQEKEEAVAV